jgi:C4-type Zn-finger protein
MRKQYYIVCDKCGQRLTDNDYIGVQEPHSEDLTATKVDYCRKCYQSLLQEVVHDKIRTDV